MQTPRRGESKVSVFPFLGRPLTRSGDLRSKLRVRHLLNRAGDLKPEKISVAISLGQAWLDAGGPVDPHSTIRLNGIAFGLRMQ
ncbi:hypothetical protein Poly51_13350 [Rubripirellula tenax]|uniref:Uncharacterized protein n=1 Tax=Rubripirellula tenax TaxID=2528015 RepID=A0A5C6FEL0_9BACT|nr:hypothetical protein Poly51_13350 [Rubripirellula tenax]